MTVRFTVKTHGCPASVSVDGADPVTVDHHQQRTFDVSGSSTITVTEEEPSADHGAVMAAEPLDKTEGASAFDHDGDGRVGGSKRKSSSEASPTE